MCIWINDRFHLFCSAKLESITKNYGQQMLGGPTDGCVYLDGTYT